MCARVDIGMTMCCKQSPCVCACVHVCVYVCARACVHVHSVLVYHHLLSAHVLSVL